MPKEIDGKTFHEAHEVEDPLTEEQKAETLALVAEFDRIRDAIPPDQLRHLPDKYGDEDRLGTSKEAEYLAEVERRKERGEYWG
ncbi:hypothetical protein [Nocardia altamirensis]|uniref:hypothetical protein n=1 Tax=Nocardia altamirensis TaxID=472158 RepID=UPI00084027D8|nr:hypothetical protein [Nocardia altamirensis]